MNRSRFFEGFILGIISTILGLFIVDYYTDDVEVSSASSEGDESEGHPIEDRVSKTLDAIEDKFDKLSDFIDSKKVR